MAVRKYPHKLIVIVAIALIVIILLLPPLGHLFGLSGFDTWTYVAIPALLFFVVRRPGRRGGSTERSNPHINKDLIEKLERLEKLEELEKRPDRDKQIPGLGGKDR
jgi:hypothetical protein